MLQEETPLEEDNPFHDGELPENPGWPDDVTDEDIEIIEARRKEVMDKVMAFGDGLRDEYGDDLSIHIMCAAPYPEDTSCEGRNMLILGSTPGRGAPMWFGILASAMEKLACAIFGHGPSLSESIPLDGEADAA